jgi:hypothetical protein
MKRGTAIFLAAVAAELVLALWLLEGKTWPDVACPAVVDAWQRIDAPGRLYHDLKNLGTELFRCDSQWWFKFSGFMWVSEAVVIIALVAWVISLKWRRS